MSDGKDKESAPSAAPPQEVPKEAPKVALPQDEKAQKEAAERAANKLADDAIALCRSLIGQMEDFCKMHGLAPEDPDSRPTTPAERINSELGHIADDIARKVIPNIGMEKTDI